LIPTQEKPFHHHHHYIQLGAKMNKYAETYLIELSSKIANAEGESNQSAYGLIKRKIKDLFTRPTHGVFASSPYTYLKRVKELEASKQVSALASN